MKIMKKFLKILGIIIGLYFIWSIFFHSIIENEPSWHDSGVLEVMVYLFTNSLFSFEYFFLSVVVFTILIKLKKNNKIRFINKNLFAAGYFIIVIIGYISWRIILGPDIYLNSDLFIVNISRILFNPLIYSLICYNLTNSLLNKKNKR